MSKDIFGFRVVPDGYKEDWEDDEDRHKGWSVSLPHQCDRWDIAGDSSSYSATGLTQDEAIIELMAFILEAQEALAALREGRGFGTEE